MNETEFSSYVTWAAKGGIRLNPSLERRCVNGVYGLYAKQPITKNDILVATASKIKKPKVRTFRYPKNLDPQMKAVHAYANEYSKGENSEFALQLRSFADYDTLKQSSVYYFTDDELRQVEALSPLLHQRVVAYRQRCDKFIHYLCQLDPALDRSHLEVVFLNYVSRAFRGRGLVPLFDLFNHSDEQGMPIDESGAVIRFKAGRTYQPGEQVFIHYGKKDLYDHAIDYGYFDPEGRHFIDVSQRIAQVATSDLAKRAVAKAAQKLAIKTEQKDGALYYNIATPNAFIEETQPSPIIIEFIQRTCFQTEMELMADKCRHASFEQGMNQLLEGLLSYNRVEACALTDIPPKLHYLYHMLEKERKILIANKSWLKKQNIQSTEG